MVVVTSPKRNLRVLIKPLTGVFKSHPYAILILLGKAFPPLTPAGISGPLNSLLRDQQVSDQVSDHDRQGRG